MGTFSTNSDDGCPVCGRPIDNGSSTHASQTVADDTDEGGSTPFLVDPFDDLAASGDAATHQESTATRNPRFGRRALAVAAVVGVVGIGLGSLFGILFGSDRLPDETARQDAVFDRDDAEVFGEGEIGPDRESGPDRDIGGDPNFPPSDEHMEAEEIASLFDRALGADSATYGVAYVSDEGLMTVGPWGAGKPDVQIARTLDQAIGNPLISDGARTWAIDDGDPQLAYIVSNRFEVVATELSGNLAFIRKEKGRVEIGLTAYGGRQSGVQIPRLSDVVTVAGRGLLVAPATGGTYVVDPTGELRRLNEDRIVSAGLDSEVYQRCDEVLSCETYALITDTDGQRVTAPLDLAADNMVTISPDGAYVVGLDGDDRALSMISTETGDVVNFGEQTVLATGWAPDSSFLAVAVPGSLHIISAADGEMVSIALPSDPVSESLLVFVV